MKGNGISYVKCQVEPGMFKDEWLALIDAVDPKNHRRPARVQLFVDQREVAKVKGTPRRNAPAVAWLRVTVVVVRHGLGSVILPQPATPFGENVLVRSELLRESPEP